VLAQLSKGEISFSDLSGFTDKQWIATETADAHKYTLFGGSRGPGKSYWLRWYLVRFLLRAAAQGFRNMRVMLACENYPALRERHLTKITTEFPAWLGYYVAGGNEFRLHQAYGGGVIALRNLDDPSKYQSSEYACIAIDELTKNPERTFHLLRGSLRWSGFAGVKFIAASNPEPNWVRDYFIEKRVPEELQGDVDEFAFVPALPEDNPHLPESYWQMLETLPGALRAAWRFGDWYAAVEGLVYANFGVENITDQEPIHGIPFDIAVDDGYIDPRATLLLQRLPGGAILVFDELYERQTLEERSIENMLAKFEHYNLRKPSVAAVSHEAVALRKRMQTANINAVNWLARPIGGGKSTRLAAINLTRAMICDGKGKRNILVHKRCANLLDELRAGYRYPEGKHGLDTEPLDQNDHAVQALESYVWYRYGGTAVAQPARVREY
jgi:hypothetical protein